jgi:hypothetical protein
VQKKKENDVKKKEEEEKARGFFSLALFSCGII